MNSVTHLRMPSGSVMSAPIPPALATAAERPGGQARARGVRPDPLVSPTAYKELAERAGKQLRRRLAAEKGR